jgi:lysophospholipid acyltransferase (LPLAT)-like uncharacterized protein
VKQFLRRDGVQRVLAALIASYAWTTFRLTRWTMVNAQHFQNHGAAGKPFIVCFWHGRMMLMPNFWHWPMRLYALGSPHRDGQLTLRTLQNFGVQPISGSSTRGGARALREMMRRIEEGHSIVLSPDGPRGPRMRASAGIIALAKLAGVPIVPIALSVTRGKVLGTWDRFLVAYPFGRGVFVGGDPITVPADADAATLEAARQKLETMLNDITAEADRRCGRVPVQPAPAEAGEAARLAESEA